MICRGVRLLGKQKRLYNTNTAFDTDDTFHLALQPMTVFESAPLPTVYYDEEQTIEADLKLLVNVLPPKIQTALAEQDLDALIEVVMDLGRVPEARFRGNRFITLGTDLITEVEIDHVVRNIGAFTSDNRAGIPRTLHRISAIRNRQGNIIGLTCRVGKAITGTIECIKDLVDTGKSILLLGPPGVGKTTKLREISKMIADEQKKRVVIVDTSNEIAGDGDIPHPAVGRSRRMQVDSPEKQKEVMIEAVENHTPQVIVVDEIGTDEEAQAARTIAERGVILIATAHGSTLENLIKNPTLSDLIGGIQSVTLGDDEAKRRASQKTVLEREKKPTFDICIEIRDQQTLAVYPDVAEAVDHLLRGWTIFPEMRKVDHEKGTMRILQSDVAALPDFAEQKQQALLAEVQRQPVTVDGGKPDFRFFLYGLNRAYVERIIERLHLQNVLVTNQLYDADAIIALKGSTRPGSKIAELAKDYEIPIFVTKSDTMPQIQRAMREALNAEAGAFADKIAAEEDPHENETQLALQEAETAMTTVRTSNEAVELKPRRSFIRRLQHELVEKNDLRSVSIGDEPNRRLKILPE